MEELEYYQGHDRAYGTLRIPLSPHNQLLVNKTKYALDNWWNSRLDKILAFHQPPETIVLIVEIPVHRLTFDEVQKYIDHDLVIREISERAAARGVLFWSIPLTAMGLDNSKWQDVNHLNAEGADLFTAWLAEQISAAVNEGRLDL